MHFVIARYKEDIAWSEQLPKTVYNKYHDEPIHLPNIGREAHTYLTFITRNWDWLPERMIFLQADPLPHCHNMVETINSLKWTGYEPLGHWIAHDNKYGLPNAGFELEPWWVRLVTQYHTDMKCPHEFRFGAGACFAVTRECVRKHPRGFYEHILGYAKEHHFAYAMERFWGYIFTSHEVMSRQPSMVGLK